MHPWHEIYVDDLVKRYIVDLVARTRDHPDVYLGASPRGTLALYRTSQAYAALAGRDFVVPDDVKAMALDTLGHRLIVNPAARVRSIETEEIIDDVVAHVPVPGATVRR